MQQSTSNLQQTLLQLKPNLQRRKEMGDMMPVNQWSVQLASSPITTALQIYTRSFIRHNKW